MALGRDINFIENNIISLRDISLYENTPPINNVIYKTEKDELKWIEETTMIIGEWRSIFRSCYIRWALTINGLYQANEKYEKYVSDKKLGKFKIESIRVEEGNFGVKTPIALWDFRFAADAHLKTVNMIAAWGIIDLYGCVEKLVFSLFKIFLDHNPLKLMEGKEYRGLRNLYRQRNNSSEDKEKWIDAWEKRITAWQRKKLYDGIDKVFLDYCSWAGIKQPSYYKYTTPQTWAETIKVICILRNCLIHGSEVVPIELSELCKNPYAMGWNFEENQTISVNLNHLQMAECFLDQLLSALNGSLLEIAEKEILKDSKS